MENPELKPCWHCGERQRFSKLSILCAVCDKSAVAELEILIRENMKEIVEKKEPS